MQGSRPMTDTEIEEVLSYLKTLREQALFIVGCKTGFRISELLSLTVADVTQYGAIRNSLTVARSNMKGKNSSRTVPLHPKAKAILEHYVFTIKDNNTQTKLFDFSRQYAHKILKTAFHKARLSGKVSTHSMRKTFCDRVYTALGENIFKTQQAMGHRALSSTASYLSFKQDEINKAITGE